MARGERWRTGSASRDCLRGVTRSSKTGGAASASPHVETLAVAVSEGDGLCPINCTQDDGTKPETGENARDVGGPPLFRASSASGRRRLFFPDG